MGCDHPVFVKRSFELPCRDQRYNLGAVVIVLVRHKDTQSRVGEIEEVRSCLIPVDFEDRISLRDWVQGVRKQEAKVIPRFWL